jgi:hypothetical protein
MSNLKTLHLIQSGATDLARKRLKKLSIEERMVELNGLIPWVRTTPAILKFFHLNFSVEIGAIIGAASIDEAVKIYRESKKS